MKKNLSHRVPELLCQLLSPFTMKAKAASIFDEVFYDEDLTDLLIELANRHFLIPTLYKQLCLHELDTRLAPELLEFMIAMSDFMSQRNIALIKQSKEIISIANQNGITPLLMKGASALFADVYPDRGVRFMSDLDILFPEGRVLEVAEILEGIGFSVPDKYLPSGDIEYKHVLPRGQHLLPVYRQGDACAVEVHVRPLAPYFKAYMTNNSVYSESLEIDDLKMEGLSAVRMSSLDEIIHCFVHSELAHRNYHYGVFDLRQMDYFVRLIYSHHNEMNWETLYSRIKKPKDKAVFEHFIVSLNTLFGTCFPLDTKIVSDNVLKTRYKKGIASCFPRYHPYWKVERLITEYTSFLSERQIMSLYDIPDDGRLWKLRLHRTGVLIMKYSHPVRLISRIQHTIRVMS